MCYHQLTKSYLVLSKERKYLFCAYFCQTMKIPFKAIAALIILSLIGVFAYQAYWLTGLYTSMKKDMDNCLIETLQVSDYNEMMERCDSVKRSNETINGYIESSINLDSSALITKVIETEPFKQQKDLVWKSMNRYLLLSTKTVHWNCSPNTSNGVSTASWTFSRKSTCTLSTAFYKDTCHARNHLPASSHRNSEFTSRQHDHYKDSVHLKNTDRAKKQ